MYRIGFMHDKWRRTQNQLFAPAERYVYRMSIDPISALQRSAMWHHGARLTRRGWVSQPVGRGDLSPTTGACLEFWRIGAFRPSSALCV